MATAPLPSTNTRSNRPLQTVKAVNESMAKKLQQSKLTLADARTLRLRPYTADQVAKKFPKLPVYRAGFDIPYWDLDRKPTGFHRFRYLEYGNEQGFAALVESKPLRYGQESSTLNELYLPPLVDWREYSREKDKLLIITEGELKAACATKYGLPSIGLGGVWCFKSSRKRLPLLHQFLEFEWKERKVFICYDSDAVKNPEVSRAENALSRELCNLGAHPFICRIPCTIELEKVGLDDYIAAYGIEAFKTNVLEKSFEWRAATELFTLNEEVVYVEDPGVLLKLDNFQRITPRAFVEHAYAPRTYREQQIHPNGVRMTEKSAAREWLKWPHRATVKRTTYEPGKPRITEGGNLNLWDGFAIAPIEGNVEPWVKLLDYLFAGSPEGDRVWFERWLAYPLQHPGTKLYSAVVMWSLAHGTGKSTVGYTMAPIYGNNFAEISDHHLHTNFNEWAENKQFVMGDEITGGDKRSIADRMKSLITQRELRVNRKYIPSYSVPDCINYFFTSNHPDAFFLEDTDRRFFIHEIKQRPKPVDWFREYYVPWKDQGGTSALFHYLLHLDLGDFKPEARAHETLAKRKMIEIGQSKLAAWCSQLRSDPEATLIAFGKRFSYTLYTTEQLLKIYDPSGETKTTSQAMGRELEKAGFHKVPNDDPNTKVRNLTDERGQLLPKKPVWLIIGTDTDRASLATTAAVRDRFNRERNASANPFRVSRV